jgi:hypothetical protein
MFNAFAVPEIVGFVGLRVRDALFLSSFAAASAKNLTSSSRDSGFLVSIPDIVVTSALFVYHLVYKSVGVEMLFSLVM